MQHQNGWRVVGASVAGAGHEKAGRGCQDVHNWRRLHDGTVVAAIADGAGSAALGQAGAEAAVGAAIDSLAGNAPVLRNACDNGLWRNLFADSLSAARAAVKGEAIRRKVFVGELAATLILIVVRPDCVGSAQIGDGAVTVETLDGRVIPLTRPPIDDSVNATTFVTSDHAIGGAQFGVWRQGAAHLAAFTDGLQMLALKLPEGEPFEPFFKPLFHFADENAELPNDRSCLEEFLRSPRITARTDDDLTLFIATSRPFEAAG